MSTKNQLKTNQVVDLGNLVRTKFTEKGVNDDDFAAFATVELGFKVNGNNVAGMRKAFGIAATAKPPAPAKPATLAERVAGLEQQLAQVQGELATMRGVLAAGIQH